MRLSKSLRKNKSKLSRKNKLLRGGSNTKKPVLSNYALNAIKRLSNSLTAMEENPKKKINNNQEEAQRLQQEFNRTYEQERERFLEEHKAGEARIAARLLQTKMEWEKRQQKLKEENKKLKKENEALKKVIANHDRTHDFPRLKNKNI